MQQNDSAPVPPVGLGFLIAAARRRLKQVMWARLQPFHLTPQHVWVLMLLQQRGPLSLHALAREAWMDDPTASRVVKLLGGKGLLRSETDPTHGRRILIRLTSEGRHVLRQVETLSGEISEQLVAGVEPGDQQVFREALNRMILNLEALADQAPKAPRSPARRLKASSL